MMWVPRGRAADYLRCLGFFDRSLYRLAERFTDDAGYIALDGRDPVERLCLLLGPLKRGERQRLRASYEQWVREGLVVHVGDALHFVNHAAEQERARREMGEVLR